MFPHSDTIQLSPNVFTILRDLIHERTGLYYDSSKRELLAEKLTNNVMARGFDSFLDFYYLLKYGPNAEAEWPNVLNALSVQETYFCREMGQITALVNEILPAYCAARPQQEIEIWCAACATGEEPLTIAMMLSETGWFQRAPIRIIASDASQQAIDKARQGVFRERSFRSISKDWHQRYFTPAGDSWRIRDDLLKRITFSRANLMDQGEINLFARVPFIFCRNVFIYFSDDAITRTVTEFARRMSRPGYLFVGASESLLRLTTDFELEAVGDAFAYKLGSE